MNSKVRTLVVTLLILAFASTLVPMLAQEEDTYTLLPSEPNTTGGEYCFGPPDVRVNAMWHVFHEGWRTALSAPENAELRIPLHGKVRESFRNNTTYYAVDPGECVWAPAGMKVYVPLRVQKANTDMNAPTGATGRMSTDQTVVTDTLPSWLMWLLIATAGITLLWFLASWLYIRNPTEWRPIVPGGIRDEAHASEVFQQYAPRGGTLIQGSQRRVRLSGPWLTRHAGILFPIPHHYNNERAWSARFRMPNGTERESFMLQGCGNDVSAGARYIMLPGATVTEGWGEETQVSPTPSTQPASAPIGAHAEPTPPTATTPAQATRPSQETTGRRRVIVPGEPAQASRAFISVSMQNGPTDTTMVRWENGVERVTFHNEDGINTLRFSIRDN